MVNYDNLEEITQAGMQHIYCPVCGNILEVVSNGWFGGQLFFCNKCEKVFSIYLRNITKNSGEDFINQCKKMSLMKEVTEKINFTNMEEVNKLLTK